MKHAIWLLIAILSFYGAWVVSTKKDRKKVMGLTMTHGLKIGVIVMLVVIMLLSAVSYKSISIV